MRRKFIGNEIDFKDIHDCKTTDLKQMLDKNVVSGTKNQGDKSVYSSNVSEIRTIKTKRMSNKNLNKYNFKDLNN